MDFFLMLKKACNIYSTKIYTPLNKLNFKINHVKYGKKFCSKGLIYIYRHYESAKILIGNNVNINSAPWANPIGCGIRTYIQVQDGAELVIGDGCGLSNVAITCANRIELKNNVMIGSGCKIYDTDFHDIDYKKRLHHADCEAGRNSLPILIEEGAFIGAGCFILKGVTIGKHSIVGAGSVVTKDIPDDEVWAGNPARFIRKIS